MTRLVRLVAILMIFFGLAPTELLAKECKCESHRATAKGSGTCSLTEDTSYCSISYVGGSRGSQEGDEAVMLLKDYEVDLGGEGAFAVLNARPPRDLDPNVLLKAIAGAAISTIPSKESPFYGPAVDEVRRFIESMFERGKFSPKPEVRALADTFVKRGCINFRKSTFRFLLISRFSELDRSCE